LSFLRRADAVQQFGSSDKGDSEAGRSKHDARIAGIVLQIMNAAFDRPDGDGVSHKISLKAGLDDEQSTDLAKHLHW
jgi:hypothetical protein